MRNTINNQTINNHENGKNRAIINEIAKRQLCFGKCCSYCQQHKYGCQD